MNNGHDFQLVPDALLVGVHRYEKYKCSQCGYWYVWNVDSQSYLHWEVAGILKNETCEEMLVKRILEK